MPKIIFLCSALMCVMLLADEVSDETSEASVLAHAEFSYIDSKGNTNATSLAFEGKTEWTTALHDFRFNASAYKTQTNNVDSKYKWLAEANYDYEFHPYMSANYLTGYKVDHFSGFEYQWYTGPGIGLEVVDLDNHKLEFQGNILYSQDKPDYAPVDDYLSLKFGGIYQWKIQDNVKFIQEANYRANLEKSKYYFIYSKTAFEIKVNSTVSMGMSYKIDYVNTPPPPSQQTDRTFLASLILDY